MGSQISVDFEKSKSSDLTNKFKIISLFKTHT